MRVKSQIWIKIFREGPLPIAPRWLLASPYLPTQYKQYTHTTADVFHLLGAQWWNANWMNRFQIRFVVMLVFIYFDPLLGPPLLFSFISLQWKPYIGESDSPVKVLHWCKRDTGESITLMLARHRWKYYTDVSETPVKVLHWCKRDTGESITLM